VEAIDREILSSSTGVTFASIVGLEDVKRALTESVILPIVRPELFTGIRTPPKGLLLYGPPGNGKTLIAKAAATECHCTFFSISASSLVSKNFGEGEKTVRTLFAVARARAPSLIFIDEIDSILSRRSSQEHEASRRLKTEFLVAFDGVNSSQIGPEGDKCPVTVLAASNRPEELDEAVLRRLPRRIYIPLPDANARQSLIANLIATLSNRISKEDMKHLVAATDNYSYSDLTALCSEAALGPLRSVPMDKLLHTPNKIKSKDLPPITYEHFPTALSKIRPSVTPERLIQYISFAESQSGE
jgi:spastin